MFPNIITNTEHYPPISPDFSAIFFPFFSQKSTHNHIWRCTLDAESIPQHCHQQWATSKLIIASSKPPQAHYHKQWAPTVQMATNFHEGRRACDHATRSTIMWRLLLGWWPGFQWSNHDSDYLPTLGGHTSFSVAITYGTKIERNSYKCIWSSHSKCEAQIIMKEVTIKWHKSYSTKPSSWSSNIMLLPTRPCDHAAASMDMWPIPMTFTWA